MERYELRALMLATMMSTHNLKRPINDTELKEALAHVDVMIAATCPSCDGTGKFDTGMDPSTRARRPEDLVPCDHGAPREPDECGKCGKLHETTEACPVLETKTAQQASAQLATDLAASLEVKCKACGDTGRSSKGKPCICAAGLAPAAPHPLHAARAAEELQKSKVATLAKEIGPVGISNQAAAAAVVQVGETPQETRAIYATEEYVCEKCDNANLTVELIVNKTPQTSTYTCKDCGNKGDIVLETEDDYTDFVTSAQKIKQEVKEPPKKPRAKKAEPTPAPTPTPPANDMPVVETAAPAQPSLLEQFKAPVTPIPNKLPAPIVAAAQAAEQHVTGSTDVQISEVAPVDTNAARESLKGMFDTMEDEKVIKEWESMTSKVFDPKVMQLATLRSELLDRLLGLY